MGSQGEGFRGQFCALAAADLPLVVVSDMLRQVDRQERREREAADAEIIERLLPTCDTTLLDALRETRASAPLLRRAAALQLDEDDEGP